MRGILVQGSNGEAQLLSHEERKIAIRITRDTLDKNGFTDTLILAGTGAQSTKETIKLCSDAAEAGANYVLVLTPSTWPKQMTVPNIIRFFHAVRICFSLLMSIIYDTEPQFSRLQTHPLSP